MNHAVDARALAKVKTALPSKALKPLAAFMANVSSALARMASTLTLIRANALQIKQNTPDESTPHQYFTLI